ncbi:MAG TPA: hypothetical protein IAB92_08695 [Candidatus Faecousia faecigallinarum]|nr:hypothetical protein [Candidatus Faecousia faecigallinarum]
MKQLDVLVFGHGTDQTARKSQASFPGLGFIDGAYATGEIGKYGVLPGCLQTAKFMGRLTVQNL